VSDPRRASGVDSRDVDGEVVLYDGTSLHRLDMAGSAVWRLVDGGTPVSMIVQTLSEEFGVDPARVAVDVATLLAVLVQRGLVRTD
jgi:hypothetical protein